MQLPDTLKVGRDGGYSFVVMPVLQFLWGRPWDAVAASWLSTLEPMTVRHSADGCIQLSASPGRVTVYTVVDVLPLKIERIEMECHVDLYGGIAHGDDLMQRTPELGQP